MKKCKRCGKMHEDDYIEVCDVCGFDFEEHIKVSRILSEAEPSIQQVRNSDLLDFPILTFVFGIVGLILPIFIFSFIAIHFSKRPAKDSLEPLRNLGRIFGYVGMFISMIAIVYIIFTFIL